MKGYDLLYGPGPVVASMTRKHDGIGRAVVYYARDAHALSAGIKSRHCSIEAFALYSKTVFFGFLAWKLALVVVCLLAATVYEVMGSSIRAILSQSSKRLIGL